MSWMPGVYFQFRMNMVAPSGVSVKTLVVVPVRFTTNRFISFQSIKAGLIYDVGCILVWYLFQMFLIHPSGGGIISTKIPFAGADVDVCSYRLTVYLTSVVITSKERMTSECKRFEPSFETKWVMFLLPMSPWEVLSRSPILAEICPWYVHGTYSDAGANVDCKLERK